MIIPLKITIFYLNPLNFITNFPNFSTVSQDVLKIQISRARKFVELVKVSESLMKVSPENE